jgi:mono/diheme cytochrome c family protein
MSTDVTSSTTPQGGRWHRWTPVLGVAVAALLAPLAGLGADAATAPDDDTLRAGAEVYSSVCASCHQPGGVGLPGRYPPLIDNPNVADAAYVEDVIRNGQSGPITVNGETYDGVMPAQSTLSDTDVTAVIAYIQSGFAAPAGPVAEVTTGPAAGTELPLLANYAWIAAFAIAIGLGALVLGPRVVAAHDRREIPWVDAWMKTAVIAVGAILATTIVPAKVLELETVQELPRAAQDLIAVSLWSAGVVGTILALWYAHRERRV